MDNQITALETTKGSQQSPNILRTLFHKRLKMGQSYLPIPRKCRTLIPCQSSQREVTEQNSTKVCDTLESELNLQTNVRNLRGSLRKNGEL